MGWKEHGDRLTRLLGFVDSDKSTGHHGFYFKDSNPKGVLKSVTSSCM